MDTEELATEAQRAADIQRHASNFADLAAEFVSALRRSGGRRTKFRDLAYLHFHMRLEIRELRSLDDELCCEYWRAIELTSACVEAWSDLTVD